MIGEEIHALGRELFPICRSITGQGVRDTLARLREIVPEMEIHAVPSGERCFDWIVPPEWNIRDAYILAPDGSRIADFSVNNLHVVGYSVPVDRHLELHELQNHLYSLPEQPQAIPYVTSYYEDRWGFCISHQQRESLRTGTYYVRIDSTKAPGVLNYGEIVLPGAASDEVFVSTYVCHPSMANNELSGPTVAIHLAKWLRTLSKRRLSYRFVFIPETIGSIVYLSRNLDHLRAHVVAGFNVTCVGDDRQYSYLSSRRGDTLADRVARHVLSHLAPGFVSYSYLERGSDERQYCSPGVDLPVACIMRSKPGGYPEYHTSLDDFTLVTPSGLEGAFRVLQRCLECIEANITPHTRVLGEPQLGRRGLYPTLSTKDSSDTVKDVMDLLAYSDGSRDLLAIADTIDVPMWKLWRAVEILNKNDLLAVK